MSEDRASPTIFERILRRELPASFVHEDERCAAFMDIRPIAPGHVLVVSRQAVATLTELDAETRAHLFEIAHRIGLAQQEALGSRGQHVLVNDGRAASQTVPHVHVHVVPRYGGDTIAALGGLAWHLTTLVLPKPESKARRRKLDDQARAINAALSGLVD